MSAQACRARAGKSLGAIGEAFLTRGFEFDNEECMLKKKKKA